MTSKRQAGMFYEHARKLALPEQVYKYVLRALLDGTATADILRSVAEVGASLNLNPYGVASQVHRLLCWDFKKHTDDYTANPMNASICDCVGDITAAGSHKTARSTDEKSNNITLTTKDYLHGLVTRRWADDCCLYGYTLPSHGTRYDRCGKYVVMGCLHDDGQRHSKTVRFSCNRLTCPVCYKNSMKRHAVNAAKRLMVSAMRRSSSLYTKPQKLIYHHVAVSVHQDNHEQFKTPDGVDRYRKKMFKNIKWLGYRGGLVIYHPWEFKGGIHFAPHFHIIAAGCIDREKYLRKNGKRIMLGKMEPHPISEVHRRTGGDTYTIISQASSFDDLAAMITYLLTHVGLRIPKLKGEGGSNYGHVLAYFGDTSNNKFSTKKILSYSSESGSDIDKIERSLMSKVDDLKQSADVSMQMVTCPPRHGGGKRDKRYGSLSNVDIRSAKYGAIKNVKLNNMAAYLRENVARLYNAPILEKEWRDRADKPADEPHRYIVARLNIYEKYDSSRVRSKFTVIALEPSTVNLCHKCGRVLHAIVRLGGGGIPPPDRDHPEDKQFMYNDAANWTRYQPGGMHHGRGVPYYGDDGSPHWDMGIKSMPVGVSGINKEYRSVLQREVDESFTKRAVSMMRRQDPDIDKDAAEYVVRHYLASNGTPTGGWKDDTLKDLWAEYTQMYHTDMPPGPDASDGNYLRADYTAT